MDGLKNLFGSKKATIAIILGSIISVMMWAGAISTELGAELLAVLGVGYGVGPGLADHGGAGGVSNQ